jgi:hypothetical protein
MKMSSQDFRVRASSDGLFNTLLPLFPAVGCNLGVDGPLGQPVQARPPGVLLHCPKGSDQLGIPRRFLPLMILAQCFPNEFAEGAILLLG